MAQLAELIRKKHPGAYDDMDDISLEKAVLAKHPEYQDLVKPEEHQAVTKPIVQNHNPLQAVSPDEPDTKLGGWVHSLKSDFMSGLQNVAHQFSPSGMVENPMLQSAAHPQGFMDLASLIVPSEMPHMPGVGRMVKGGLSRIAESVAGTSRPPTSEGAINFATKAEADLAKPLTTETRPSGPWDTNVPEPVKPVASPINPEDAIYNTAKRRMGITESPLAAADEPFLPPTRSNRVALPKDDWTADFAKPKFEPKTPDVMPIGEGIGERFQKSPEPNQKFELNDQSGFDETRQFFIDDSARMKAERLAREADPVYQSSQKAKIDDWNTTQNNLRINSQVEKEFGINFMSGSDRSYSDLSPAEQAKFDNRVSELMGKSKFKSSTIDVESVKPKAVFKGMQETGIPENPEIPLYDIVGGPSHGSTVTGDKLKELGIEQPPVPEGSVPVRGEELRKKAQVEMRRQKMAKQSAEFGRQESSIEQQISEANDMSTSGNVPPKKPPIDTSSIPSGEFSDKPPSSPTNQGNLFADNPNAKPEEKNLAQGLWDLVRGLKSADLPYLTSAAFRQGGKLAGTKSWFKSWAEAAKSFHSEQLFDASQAAIENHPLVRSGQAKSWGMEFTDLKNLSSREEVLRSDLAEKIPLYGKYIRASNRAYTSFLNNLRLGTLDNVVKIAESQGMNPKLNQSVGRELAEAINTLTGRGKLGVEFGKHEFSVEGRAAKVLSNLLWSPRSVASNIRMINPSTYMFANPVVRKQYAYGLLRQIGGWATLAGISSLAGASINRDPTNPDFGKIRIGNTRIDPPAGLQQYLVLAARELSGGTTSSNSGKFTPFGKGPFSSSPSELATKFLTDREHPTIQLAAEIANTLISVQARRDKYTKGEKLADNVIQGVLPMYVADIAQILEENPDLADQYKAMLAAGGGLASSTGMGVNSYSSKSQFDKPVFSPMFMNDRTR